MTQSDLIAEHSPSGVHFASICRMKWNGALTPRPGDTIGHDCIDCPPLRLRELCSWLVEDNAYRFATLVAEDRREAGILLRYEFFKSDPPHWVEVVVRSAPHETSVPSISDTIHAADWHEREIEDLFGVHFEGHPRLGEFILHEDWPEGVNPMRATFDAGWRHTAEAAPQWDAPTIVTAPGSFAMPIGPVFADFAESALFLLESVGEDVIHVVPRFFYKYRGVEKIAEGQPADRVLLLAERFSGIAAFAHALGFCLAVEAIHGIAIPRRASVLRTVFAELERLRHHAAAIAGICASTALAVAQSQAALIEEELLRLSGAVAGHRYLFGLAAIGGLGRDLADEDSRLIQAATAAAAGKLRKLHEMLRVSSSFLDRLEEVGTVPHDTAIDFGLVGPVARASGIDQDTRASFPYAAYEWLKPRVPTEEEGDGYARLRILFQEADQSATLIQRGLAELPTGAVVAGGTTMRSGAALSVVEAPLGAAFHWVRLGTEGIVERYRIAPPSFTNWHVFSLAVEKFAFQDFPIILASFGLSNTECDR